MQARHFLLLLLAIGIVGACKTETVDTGGDYSYPGKVLSYKKAVAEGHGIVGYVAEYEYANDTYADSFRAFHVYDLDFNERGILNQSGTGVKLVKLKRETARVLGRLHDRIELQAQPLEYNVAVILDIEELAPLKLRPANPADLKRPE